MARKKTGGRKKGTPNKCTTVLMERFVDLALDPVLGLKLELDVLNDLKMVEPNAIMNLAKAKCEIYLELMQYIFPKRRAIEVPEEQKNAMENITFVANWIRSNQEE